MVGTWFATIGVGLTLSRGTYSLTMISEGLVGGQDPRRMTGVSYYLNDRCTGTAYWMQWFSGESGVVGLVADWTYFVDNQKLYDIDLSSVRAIRAKGMKYNGTDNCTPVDSEMTAIPDGSWKQVYDLSLFKAPFTVR